MILFLLKSSACLAIFLMFYKLFLENERMHNFKRIYLLGALVLCLVIPSITFVVYKDAIPSNASIFSSDVGTPATDLDSSANYITPEIVAKQTEYWPQVLWIFYSLGVLLFSIRFLSNLRKIVRNIRTNPQLKIGNIIHVLLKDDPVPHTFLNYIFLSGPRFKAQKIPKNVLLHEATHVRQKHSFDILFVELLQIIFWFNPLFHLTKGLIKLNHEFLADAAVLDQGCNPSKYQNTLLAFASSANYNGGQPSMANAINYSSYSSIKKRFILMKTQTSKKSILVRLLLILPLLSLLLYGFSTTETVLKNQKEIVLEQEGASKNQLAEYNSLAKMYNKMLAAKGNLRIEKSDVDRLDYLYGLMTKKQRANAEPFPEFPEPPKPPAPPSTNSSKQKVNSWTVTTTANRNTRNSEDATLVPPVTPTIAMGVNRKTYSEDLNTSITKYLNANNDYEKAVANFRNRGTGTLQNLWNLYNRAIAKYVAYHVIAKEEGKFIPPTRIDTSQTEVKKIKSSNPPQPPKPSATPGAPDMDDREYAKNKIEEIIENQEIYDERSKILLISDSKNRPFKNKFFVPSPSQPSTPKTPLELLEELKSEHVKIIVDGKEISYEQAQKQFKENTFTQINVRNVKGERPVLKVASE